jgi:LacI family transcriptional regulator
MTSGRASLRKSSRRGSRSGATIHDVARRAGVSPMTVSRVVNGERNVREATREAVLAAVKDLKYAPNPAARTLAGAQATRIGLLYTNPSAAYLSEFLLGALDESSRKSAQLMLEKFEISDAAAERAAVARLIDGGVSGVVLPPPVCESHVILTELKKARIPTVAVATGRFRADASCVRIDDFKAAYEMTRYLLGLGHRRIGFIKGHPNQTASGERMLGFETALRESDLSPQPPRIEQGYFTYRSGLEAAEKLISARPRPTAIFASNDDMAAAVVSVAHRKGLDVPKDLSVVGFDDTAIATTVWPELTTIRQPIAAMAETALDVLVRDIRRRRSGENVAPVDQLVAHTLIERESASAPPR